MIGRVGCCAPAKQPHAPPISVMNSRRLFDHLVGAREQRRGHFEAERLGSLEIDDQLDFRGLHDRQVGGLFTLENATRVKSDLSVILYQAVP